MTDLDGGTVSLASEGLAIKDRTWSMRQEMLAPQYTKDWDSLPMAKA